MVSFCVSNSQNALAVFFVFSRVASDKTRAVASAVDDKSVPTFDRSTSERLNLARASRNDAAPGWFHELGLVETFSLFHMSMTCESELVPFLLWLPLQYLNARVESLTVHAAVPARRSGSRHDAWCFFQS